ncbi:MAG: cytochrome-c oxidase [Gammaproteobacteria bacterium]|nr:cytochrome-c oxidase [Gammaproteobacteria bacterium]
MGALWLKIAVVYVLIGMLVGLYMGATEQMQYIPVHAHLNLLGWVTLALAGLVYQIFPRMAASPLQRWHFWLHNLGLPVSMVSLALMINHRPALLPVVIIGAIVVFIGMLLFAINLFRNAKA